MRRCASARAWSARSPPRRGRSTCRTPSPTRPSPTCRRPARRSTTPSSACRSCGPAARSACSSSRTAPHRTYYDEEVEALQTTAMVLAEMIAVGELEGLARPGTLARPQAADHASPASASAKASALGHVVLHEPRVVVTALIAEDAEQRSAAARRGDRQPRLFVDDMLSRDDIARDRRAPRGARGLSDVRPRPRLGAAHARGDPQRPDRRGGGREGAERHPGPAAAPDRSVPARPAARFRRPRQPAAARADEQGARAVGAGTAARRDHRRAQHGGGGTARLRPRAGARPGARGGRPDQPRHHRRPGARHRHGRAGRQRRRRWSRTATRSSSTALAGEVHIRPTADVEAAYAEKVRFRAKRQEQYRLLRDKPAVTRDGQRIKLADECRPGGRPAASGRIRRGGHRPVPHRTAVHDRREDAEARRADGASTPTVLEAAGDRR